MTSCPEDSLGNLLSDASPGFACGEDLEDGVFQCRMNNVTTEGQVDLSKRRRVPRNYRNIHRFLVEPGDVLFNATNSPDLVGKAAFFSGLDEPAVFSNHFLRLRPCQSKLEGRYLARWLNLLYRQKRFKGICRQWVNQATVGRDALLSLRLPVPPLSEQRRIAAILDKADALRAERRAAIDKLDTLTQSIFLDMFGDPATNPKEWPVRSLKESAERIQIGPFGSLLHQEDYVEGGIPLVNPKHIKQGAIHPDDSETVSSRKFAALETLQLDAGDVVMGRRGEMGRCATVEKGSGPLLCGTGSLFIRPDNPHTTSMFLHFLLSSSALKGRLERLSLGQTLPNLNSQIVEGLQVPLPPIALQGEFAARVDAVRSLITSQAAATGTLDGLFASLQHRAFRGEL